MTGTDDPLARGFPGAPAAVTQAAAAIIAGAVPEADLLAALGPEGIDAARSNPGLRRAPHYIHNLPRQALQSRNLAAAEALLAAGGSAQFNQGEMGFAALQMKVGGRRLWWPDYGPGADFLRLWLAHGGTANAINTAEYGLGPILCATPPNNLEGAMVLLEAGADPWFRMPAPDDPAPEPFRYAAFFEGLANASPQASEMAFRLAHAGLYRGGSEEDRARLMALYQRLAEHYIGVSGRSDLGLVWMMQMALGRILPALGITADGALAQILAMEIPEGAGGFWLAPGEIHSPDVPAQEPNADNQRGQEMWHGH